MTEDTITAGAEMGAGSMLAACRSIAQSVLKLLAQYRRIACDECSQTVHWWNRRVWLADGARCAHLECWNGQLFLKTYVQMMAEEIRSSAVSRTKVQSNDTDLADGEIRELRASARALRERAERLEAQLKQAEELAIKLRGREARKNGKLSSNLENSRSSWPGPGIQERIDKQHSS